MPMRISLIIHELLVEGGGERQCLCLAQALTKRGHEVILYTSVYDRANCFPEICKDVRIEVTGRGILPWLRSPFFLRGYFDMRRMASSIKEPTEIWNPHHWPAQWGALWLSRKLGGSVVWMCNDVPDFYEKAVRPQSLKSRVLAPLYWLYYVCDRAQNKKVNLSMFLSKWAESEYKSIYRGRTQVVRSGADPSRFKPGGDRKRIRERFGYHESEFVLLWLGIFMPHRRLEDAIEAVALLAPRGVRVKLLLAGSDRSYPQYLSSLKALARSRGVESEVTFTGKITDEEIQDFYAACDAFLFPNDKQTWGLVVLEAMACGCLAMVSTGAGVHEVLSDGENAVLFPPRNPPALAAKIASVVDAPTRRQEIARNGMRLVRDKYNWERFADQVELICGEFIEENSPHEVSQAEVS